MYVSALNFGGEPLRLLNMARLGEIRLDVSATVLDEVERVLCEKFRWAPANAKQIRAEIERFANVITPSESLTVVKADPILCARRDWYFPNGLLKVPIPSGAQIATAE